MMHQKSKKLLVFDKFKRKSRFRKPNLRYISYSIPLACIMALVFGLVHGMVFINDNQTEVFAETVTSGNSFATLTIAESNLSGNTVPGEIAYASTDVNYSTSNTENYSLKLSYANGYSSLKLKDSTENLTGANNKTPASMGDDSWGYAWANTNAQNDSLTYQTVPNYNSGNTLASSTIDNNNGIIANGGGKLVFAAKFGSNATIGHYQTNLLLSLAATPKNITYTLSYDANDGTGAPATQTYIGPEDSHSFVVSSSVPTRTGRVFMGWTTIATSTEVAYNAGEDITMMANDASITLYAVWGYSYKVEYNKNQNSEYIQNVGGMPENFSTVSTKESYDYEILPNTTSNLLAIAYTYNGTELECQSNGYAWNLTPLPAGSYNPNDMDISFHNGPVTLRLGVDYGREVTLFVVWSNPSCRPR